MTILGVAVCFFILAHQNTKRTTGMAFINADWPARHSFCLKEPVSTAQKYPHLFLDIPYLFLNSIRKWLIFIIV